MLVVFFLCLFFLCRFFLFLLFLFLFLLFLFLPGSYAGMYVPSIAHEIHLQKDSDDTEGSPINLAGIGLGNGWIDVETQGPMVIDYAWWHGLIDTQTKAALHTHWLACTEPELDEQAPFHNFTVPDECGLMEAVLSAAGASATNPATTNWTGGPNTYDISSWDSYSWLMSHTGSIYNLMNDPRVKAALHATSDPEVCFHRGTGYSTT
jgi:carboxypeptidase C (cathepsin A)